MELRGINILLKVHSEENRSIVVLTELINQKKFTAPKYRELVYFNKIKVS